MAPACFCAGSNKTADSEVAVKQKKGAAAGPPVKRRRRKKRGMFSRLLEGIVGLVDDDDYATASEGSSPAEQDSGHLTAPPSRSNSRRGSARGEAAATTAPAAAVASPPQQQQRPQRDGGEGEGDGGELEDVAENSAWNILGGVPFLPALVQLLSPRATTSGDMEAAASLPHPFAPAALPGDGSTQLPTAAAAAARGGQQGQPPPPEAEIDADLAGTTTPAKPLQAGQQPLPSMSQPSTLMSEEHICSLAAAVPARYRQARWTLLYSTARDGISLQTLLRGARGRTPTVLVVRDFSRHVFGAYCSEAWKLDKHYFGTGETFVFQLAPRMAAWSWWYQRMKKENNDFFQWATNEAIAVGGAGGYALWLDADLTSGISRNSTTFGNDCLAGAEEFSVGAVELWGLS